MNPQVKKLLWRLPLAALIGGLPFGWSLFIASVIPWDAGSVGLLRWSTLLLFLYSFSVGLVGIFLFRIALGRRRISRWRLLALVAPSVFTAVSALA